MFGKMPVIFRIHDGVFASRQRYAAEGIPVAQPPIQKYRKNYQPFQPCRNMNNELDGATSPFREEASRKILISKH